MPRGFERRRRGNRRSPLHCHAPASRRRAAVAPCSLRPVCRLGRHERSAAGAVEGVRDVSDRMRTRCAGKGPRANTRTTPSMRGVAGPPVHGARRTRSSPEPTPCDPARREHLDPSAVVSFHFHPFSNRHNSQGPEDRQLTPCLRLRARRAGAASDRAQPPLGCATTTGEAPPHAWGQCLWSRRPSAPRRPTSCRTSSGFTGVRSSGTHALDTRAPRTP